MHIMNYATTNVMTVQANESIDNAISLMEELELRHLVVASGGRDGRHARKSSMALRLWPAPYASRLAGLPDIMR